MLIFQSGLCPGGRSRRRGRRESANGGETGHFGVDNNDNLFFLYSSEEDDREMSGFIEPSIVSLCSEQIFWFFFFCFSEWDGWTLKTELIGSFRAWKVHPYILDAISNWGSSYPIYVIEFPFFLFLEKSSLNSDLYFNFYSTWRWYMMENFYKYLKLM